MKCKKDCIKLLEKTLAELDTLNYAEQFLDLFPDFFPGFLSVSGISVFILNSNNTIFTPYLEKKYSHLTLEPITWDANVVIYLKNSQKTIVLRDEPPARIRFLKKTNSDLYEKLNIDIIIPLFSLKKLYGFVAIEASNKTYKEFDFIVDFFKIFSNILIPMIMSERAQVASSRNYYQIYKMDRLAMVGELAASAAHEIKNPLAGISTFLRYFTELEDFNKADIIDELQVMKQSVQRIDEIVKSLLSFSRYKKKKISKISLSEFIETSLHSIALKIPANIKIKTEIQEDLIVETDSQQLQQVLINIIFNSIEAIGEKEGEIVISAYVSGQDQLPSKELFNIAINDNGPGIEDSFKEKLFQPFQTTKEDGTGLGLYTCYGLMKSLGGSININSDKGGTEVIISLPFSFEDEFGETV